MWSQSFPSWVHTPIFPQLSLLVRWSGLRVPRPQLLDSQHPLPRAFIGAFLSPHRGLEAPDKVLQKECVCFPSFHT